MKAIIPAAGLGTRFLPETKVQPKEMLLVVDRPVIQYIVEEALDAGADEVVIVNQNKWRARAFFGLRL
jgi:UTP--glucose-1-phosphate uridylyltransferase